MYEQTSLSDHELILNAIDTISNRKNRPNIARIYRHLVRFKNISAANCEKVLNELVEQERVIKVTYKGNISYRNAAKWKNPNKNKRNNTKTNTKSCPTDSISSSVLSGTVAELVVRTPTYFRTGVPCKVLEDHLLAKDGRFTKESIHKLLQKELQQETLVQLDNGNYFLALENCSSNSTGGSDTEPNNLFEMDKSQDDVYNQDGIEEINVDEDGKRKNVKKNETVEEEEGNNLLFEEELVEEEDEDEGGYKTADESREGSKLVDLSGESDDEVGVENSLQEEDKDYQPPKGVKHASSTRRDGSGRIVRNKKTLKYDPSEYVFPSLKRTYKARQDQKVTKQETKKIGKDLTPKEFKKTLLDPIPGFSGGSKLQFTSKLQRCLPIIPLKAVQFTGGTSSSETSPVCSVCKESFEQGGKNIGVRCKICNRRAHSSCADREHNASKQELDLPSWTCGSCRLIIAQPCSICNQMLSKMGPLVICGNCKLSYHRSCHKPPIPKEEALNGSWLCNYCVTESRAHDSDSDERKLEITKSLAKIGTSITAVTRAEANQVKRPPSPKFEEVLIDEAKAKIIIQSKPHEPPLREKKVCLIRIKDSNIRRQQQQTPSSNSTASSPSQTPTPSSSPPSSQLTEENIKEEVNDDCQPPPAKTVKEEFSPVVEIPDSTGWSPIDVYKYFTDEFNETVGNAFLKQEIDGNSLKLLRRSDVLRGLGLKLGLGLNVLYTVKMLQHRTSDLKVLWASKS